MWGEAMSISKEKLRALALEKAIPYRPSMARLTGSINSAILLTQILYWADRSKGGEFYKFAKPCKHKQYSEGDSFCEELGFTVTEFNSACKKLVDQRIINKRITMDRKTFYSVNQHVLDDMLMSIYVNQESWFTYKNLSKLAFTKIRNHDLHKQGILTYINYKSLFCSYTENTTENTKELSVPPPKPKQQPKSTATWEAYSNAYRLRYGVDPIRNAKVNSLLCKLVDYVGHEEATAMAAYYVNHNKAFYVQSAHKPELLLSDMQAIRTDMLNNTQTTSQQAREGERAQGNYSAAERAKARLRERGMNQ